MAVYFIDSSALVKRYISETGSTWILNLFNPSSNHEVLVASITGVCIANNLPPIIFVSADNELNAAATSEGLTIENPNNYS